MLGSSSSALRGGTNAFGEQEVLLASGINTSPLLGKSECDYVPAELERISPEESAPNWSCEMQLLNIVEKKPSETR